MCLVVSLMGSFLSDRRRGVSDSFVDEDDDEEDDDLEFFGINCEASGAELEELEEVIDVSMVGDNIRASSGDGRIPFAGLS